MEERYGATKESGTDLEPEDREDLLAALLELRGQFRKLQWYGEVNRRGFIKITKKLDKKIPTANAQKKYLALKVDPSPFATNADLFVAMNDINEWISVLSDTASSTASNLSVDDRSSNTSMSLRHSTSRQALRLPSELYALFEQQIKQDDAQALTTALGEVQKSVPEMTELAYQQLLNGFLQRAIFGRSRACVQVLLKQIVFLDDSDDINRRNCIHRLVNAIGRAQSTADREAKAQRLPDPDTELTSYIVPAASPCNPFRPTVKQEDHLDRCLTETDESITFLRHLLDNLQPTQRSALSKKDAFGKTPLHFAAEFGVCVMCEVIVEYLVKWNMFNVEQGIDSLSWQDNEGWAPLHLSVMGGHPLTTQALLDAEARARSALNKSKIRHNSPKSSAVLALAAKYNYVEIVRILVGAGVDINFQDEQGETALHVAARFGHTECAKLLLEGNELQRASTELAETTYGWTPLFVASVDGHLAIVNLLIDAGADLELSDSSGWTAKEHASLRGHMDIAFRLAEVTAEPDAESSTSNGVSSSPPSVSSIADRKSTGFGSQPTPKLNEPVKTFGHRYLTDTSMLLVSLGSMDMRKPKQAVNLDRIPITNAHSTQLDTALSIVVSAKAAEGEPEVIDLPVHDNISTEPIVFHASDPSKVKLLFDLVPTYAGNHQHVVGRAVALLSAVKPTLGSKKMPLQGDVTIPIVAANDLEVIGSVTFNFLIITPFHHPNMKINESQTYWKSMTSTMVIGHRGLGKNLSAGRRSLQLGENTIQSFIAAASLGASYVEFDVQLTKDHVPVIYHDFLVSETGVDAPVHTLTLEQFLHVNDSRTPRTSRPPSPLVAEPSKEHVLRKVGRSPRLRSMSVGGIDGGSADMDERMKHTRDFKKKGFKGNSRGTHIQAPFATLEEMFRKLPQSVGFNIEMKYPMLSESEDEEMDHYAVELNSFVDTVLEKVYELGKGRNMIFSSFNPDMCLLLNFKQPSIPVLFLTDAGTCSVGDIRASSLQEAVRFASRWNLLGIVSAAQPLVIAPRLVRVVKESGLVCVSYGAMNNDNDKVRLQVKQGIDAVIVDSVLAIRKGLTESVLTKPDNVITKDGGKVDNKRPDFERQTSKDSLDVPRIRASVDLLKNAVAEEDGDIPKSLEQLAV